jgi:phosphoribosylamine-glycine ligase
MHRFKEITNGGSRHERMPVRHNEKNMWVIKPAALNQGKGIQVMSNLTEITNFLF